MLTFKSFMSSLLVLGTGLSLMGCNLPKPKSQDEIAALGKTPGQNRSATFQVQISPEGSKAIDGKVTGVFALPETKVFTFKACVKDIAYNSVIVGHDFKIEESDQRVTTDRLGCLSWSENIAYNYLSLSKYLRLDRTITGLGLQRGSQSVTFAVNPWSHGETIAAILNPQEGNGIPEYIQEPQAVAEALDGVIGGKPVQRKLWAEDGRLFITEQKLDQDGITLNIELRPTIGIQMSKMNGEHYLRPITAGQFKARFKMIHVYFEGDKEIKRQLSESAPFDVKIENGSLSLRSPIHIPVRPTRGQMYLGLELMPMNGPKNLIQFEGLYLIGEYDAIKGMAFVRLHTAVVQDENFKLNSYVNSNLHDIQSTNGKDGFDDNTPYQKPKIEIAQLEFRFIRIGKETTSTREVIYNIKACVRHGVDQRNTISHVFKVTKFKENANSPTQTVNIRTDNNSCINWDESITFNYFDCHHNIKGQVRIQNEALSMDQSLEILVNPWENFGTIARDMRYVDTTHDLILKCDTTNRPKTQIHLDNYSYSTLSYNYAIDKFLNLTVTKKIQLRISPRVLVYSSLSSGRAETQPLRDGVYLLKAAVIQNQDYDVTNTYVTSADRIVNILDGQINTDLSFSTQDLKALGNRNNILFEIYPVDESKVNFNGANVTPKNGLQIADIIDTKSSLETQTFIGAITINMDDANRPLRIADPSALNEYFIGGKKPELRSGKMIAEIVKTGLQVQREKYARIQSKSRKAQFASETNLHLLNLNQIEGANPLAQKYTKGTKLAENLHISKQELQTWNQTGKLTPALAQKLCAFWSTDFFRTQYEEKGGVVPDRTRFNFGYQCFQAVQKDPSAFFISDSRQIIGEVGGSQLQRGFNQGLTVGAGFSLSAAHNYSKTRSFSVGGKFGFYKKFLDILSVSADVGYNMSWATSDSQSNSNAFSVNSNTSMTVQQNVFKVKVKSYEQCVTVSLNPQLFVRPESKGFFSSNSDYLDYLNPRLTEEEKINAVTKGFMICDGSVTRQEKEITENYFLIAQETNSTQIQDNGDARNRQFFIALRSQNDFNRFLMATKGQLKLPSSSAQDSSSQDVVPYMENLFKSMAPSYPGMYIRP